MKRKVWTMTYDAEYNRWMVELDGLKYGFHCGEVFRLSIGQYFIPCRIELGDDWYIVFPGAQLNLRNWETYKVEI